MKKLGTIRTKVEELKAVECENCGDPADYKFTYLLPNYRGNPASSAYCKDDCSWCSDYHTYSCKNCSQGRHPPLDGYEQCSRFEKSERFAHMFQNWVELSTTYDYSEEQFLDKIMPVLNIGP